MSIGLGLGLGFTRWWAGGGDVPPEQFSLYVGDLTGNGIFTPATITESGGIVSAVTGSGFGLTLTSQGSGSDILSVTGGLQFQNGKYLRVLTTRTLKRVQIGVSYTLLGDGAATNYLADVCSVSASAVRVLTSNTTGGGLVRLRSPGNLVMPGELLSEYNDRETMAFEVNLISGNNTVVAADNYATVTPIATIPANIPVTDLSIGRGVNGIIHRIAILMEAV